MSCLTCKEVILDYLADYLDNVLGHETAADMEWPLAHCRACVAYLHTYRRTRQLTARAVPPDTPDELEARLRRFLLEWPARN